MGRGSHKRRNQQGSPKIFMVGRKQDEHMWKCGSTFFFFFWSVVFGVEERRSLFVGDIKVHNKNVWPQGETRAGKEAIKCSSCLAKLENKCVTVIPMVHFWSEPYRLVDENWINV